MAQAFGIRGIVEGVERHVSKRVAEVCASLGNELAVATPKDTTHAASNWVWRDHPTETPEGSKVVVTWSPFRAGIEALASYSITKGKLYMTNAVHYIKDLDEGWSPQQPAPGWVSRTIRSVLESVK